MASWEMQLLSRILRKGQLAEALEWGIQPDDFLTDEGRQMIHQLLAYYMDPNSSGSQIGPWAAKHEFPNFQFCDDDSMTLKALCTEVRKQRLAIDAKAMAQRTVDLADDDPIEAANQALVYAKSILALGYDKNTDVHFKGSLDRIWKRMVLLEEGADLSVAHWPWEEVNEVTLGIQADDYIVYYGRPKSMKSWVLAKHIAHTFDQGKRPLIYTKEMVPDNIFMRVAACIARIPYQEFRAGRLTGEERERLSTLKSMVDDMHHSDDMICLSGRDAPGGKDTVEWLQSKIEKHAPDMIFIDGLYLMTDGRGPKNQKDNMRVQNISRSIRQMIFDTGIPAAATLQATRSAAKHNNAELDEIAFSDAIGQDVTAAIRVINEKTGPTIALVFGGSREYQFHGCRIFGVPATNFDYYGELTEKEIAKAKEKDADDSEAESPSAHAVSKNGKSKKDAVQREADRMSERAIKRQLAKI